MKVKNVLHYFLITVSIFTISSLLTSCFKSMARAGHDSSISDEQFQRLKKQTAVFILPVSEYSHIEDYRQLLPLAWDLTPIEVVKYSDMAKYSDASKYAYFSIHGIKKTTTNTSTGSGYSNTHYYLALASNYLKTGKKKDKVISDELCRIELYPDFSAATYSFSNKEKVVDKLYEQASIRNFSLPYMMAYLKIVQRNIVNKKNPWVYENFSDDNLRSRLSGDTLYVPENLVYNRNKFTGKEEKKDENFFESYRGKYKIVSNSELTKLIKNRNKKKPLFLFEYVLSSTDKYVGVLDISSGTIVYRHYTPLTYNLKSKDVEKILN